MSWKRILVAVDGSEQAARSLAHAVDLARRYEAELVVAHVVETFFVPPEPYGYNTAAIVQANREYGQQVLSESSEEARQGGVQVRSELLHGAPPESLIALAEEADVDLIVIGSRGRGALGRVLLGSVSTRVIHLATIPVLVVH